MNTKTKVSTGQEQLAANSNQIQHAKGYVPGGRPLTQSSETAEPGLGQGCMYHRRPKRMRYTASRPKDLNISRVSWYLGRSNRHACIDSWVIDAANPRPTMTCQGPFPGTSLKSSSLSSCCLISLAMSFCILCFFSASTTRICNLIYKSSRNSL